MQQTREHLLTHCYRLFAKYNHLLQINILAKSAKLGHSATTLKKRWLGMSTWQNESNISELRSIRETLERMLARLDKLGEAQIAISLNSTIEQVYDATGDTRPADHIVKLVEELERQATSNTDQ
jgi:hypothetical protein